MISSLRHDNQYWEITFAYRRLLGRLFNSLLNDINLIVMCILYDHNNYVINSPTH
jgi:hypothetical protein